MGNSEGRRGTADENTWKIVGNTKLGQVIEGCHGESAQIYKVRIPSMKLSKYLQLFQKRKKKPGSMIRVLDYYKNNWFACDFDENYTVITERLVRLDQIPRLSYKQGIGMIKQILILYQSLEQAFGYFQLKSEMIGRSIQGYVKIWISQNLGENSPSQQNMIAIEDDISIVRRVCQIISTHVKSHPEVFKNLFSQKKYNRSNIQNIIQLLSKMQIQKETSSKKIAIESAEKFSFQPQKQQPNKNKSREAANQKKAAPNDIKISPPNHSYPLPSLFVTPSQIPQPEPSLFLFQKYKPSNAYNYRQQQFKLITPTSIKPIPSLPSSIPFQYEIPIQSYEPIKFSQIVSPVEHHLPCSNPSYIEQPIKFMQKQPQHLSQFSQSYPTYQNPQSTSPSYSFVMNNTLKNNMLLTQMVNIPETELTRKPSRSSIQEKSTHQEMKLINSHVFITNDDLYSQIDDMIRNEKIKIQESAIVRRLSEKGSKASQK